MLDVLQIVFAAYLLLLALAAAWGLHRPVLLFPGRIFYASVQLLLFLFSFGRIRLMPLARRRRRRKSLRQAATDFQEIQLEEIRSVSWRKENDDS